MFRHLLGDGHGRVEIPGDVQRPVPSLPELGHAISETQRPTAPTARWKSVQTIVR